MDLTTLETLVQVAAVAGIAIGTFLFIARDIIAKNIFPKLAREYSTKIIVMFAFMAWSLAAVGIGAWTYMESNKRDSLVTSEAISPSDKPSYTKDCFDAYFKANLLAKIHRLEKEIGVSENEIAEIEKEYYNYDIELEDRKRMLDEVWVQTKKQEKTIDDLLDKLPVSPRERSSKEQTLHSEYLSHLRRLYDGYRRLREESEGREEAFTNSKIRIGELESARDNANARLDLLNASLGNSEC